jgi:dipeptidase
MGCDSVVALGRATAEGNTLFGHNCDRPTRQCQALHRSLGQSHAPGESIRTQGLELPQARQTYTVLGSRLEGVWGYDFGLNEHQVVVGHVRLRSKIAGRQPCLVGTDLVRLVLERSRSARQAVDLLAGLVERHGQTVPPESDSERECDSAYLVADAGEAFAVETAGGHWVYQEVREVRAVSNVSTVHQDWDRISSGLADYAIAQGWWPGDGSKLDFAGALFEDPTGSASGLRRWGRATLLLEQQNGHVDGAFLRRVLSDHYEGMRDEVDPLQAGPGPQPLCQHGAGGGGTATTASLTAELTRDPAKAPSVWCAFGPPCVSVYFPIFLEGDLPGPFTRGGSGPRSDSFGWRLRQFHEQLQQETWRWERARERGARLQERFDQGAEEFAAEAADLRRRGAAEELHRLASSFMQRNLEEFEAVFSDRSAGPRSGRFSVPARAGGLPDKPRTAVGEGT